MNIKHTLFCLIAILFLIGGLDVIAQETPSATEAVNLDEDIQPQDLGVGEPKILPGNPFYFFKNISRGIQSAFTFNPVAEAELRLKFANEKLMELKKLAKIKPEAVPEALENYKAEIDRMEEAVGEIKTGDIRKKTQDFTDQFIDNNLKHQKLFGKLEKELPSEIYENIEKTKEENTTKFADIGLKLASPEVLQEKIIAAIENQPGSDFKQFKNLEVFGAIKEKVPESAKHAIQQVIENSLKRLKGDLERMSPEDRERFKDYVENIGGNETRHLAIVDEFEREELPQIVRKELEKAKIKILERVETRLKEYDEKNLETASKKFLDHLAEQGEMENLRTVKELENNLSPEVTAQILAIKSEVTQKIVQNIEDAETPEQQKEIFEKIDEKYYDTKQLEVFKEIEELIPPEKKELYEKLKEKTIAKMKEEIEKAREMNTEEKGIIIDKLAGDAPEQIKILNEIVPKPVASEIIKETAENVIKKTELIEDPAKLEILRQKIAETEIKEVIEPLQPGVTQKLEARSETLMQSLDQNTATKQMGRAKNTIESCGRMLDPLQPELRDYIRNNPPYKTLIEAAFKHLANAEKDLAEENFGEAFGQATAASQQSSNACNAVSDIITKKLIEGDNFNKWKEFFKRLAEIAPETFPYGYDEKLVPSITILVNCAIPEVSNAKICKGAGGEVSLKTNPNRCPYFECSKKVSAEMREECAIGNVQHHKCANGEQVPWCTCKDWKWSCIDSPEKTCPTVEIRYYTCPDGTKIESGRCYVKEGGISGCSILMRPETKCHLQTPPVIPLMECPTVEEIKYYQCSDGTQIPWCMCLPEGDFAGAKNKWQCQYYPIGFTCPKAITIPTPTQPLKPLACYIQKDCIVMYSEKECLEKGGKITTESSCPASVPIPTPNNVTDYIYNDCVKEGMSKYQCPNGNVINWKCRCLVSEPEDPKYRSGGYTTWSCSVEPEKYCLLTSESPLAITLLYLKYYKPTSIEVCWATNKAIISRYVEYGTTASYGFTKKSGSSDEGKINGCAYLPSQSQFSDEPGALKPNTVYHFRIIAEDSKGNKFVSDDYSFATIPECGIGGAKGEGIKKYYSCPNGTYVDWCKCTSEGKWNCVSSPESACAVPVMPAPTAAGCKSGEIKQYKCSDGTLVDYCKCLPDGKWDCVVSPEKSCPVSATTPVPSATTEKILKLTSPNGGEKWLMGKTYDITWISQNVEKVNMELAVFKDNTRLGALGIDLNISASIGKYSWQIPDSQHIRDGNNFKVVIRNAETPASGISDPATLPEDESDNYFSIADVTPPVISVLTAVGITSSMAKIEWDTNEPATSLVVYGTTDIYHTSNELQISDSSLVIHHSVPISNLQANTLYHYRAESKDAVGNLTFSDSKFFTAAAGPTGFIESQLAFISHAVSQLIEWLKESIR